MHQRAVLAGGCFWGMQDLIRKLPGEDGVRSQVHVRLGPPPVASAWCAACAA
jgi:peptide methionine sulfoxide reductase MsrA